MDNMKFYLVPCFTCLFASVTVAQVIPAPSQLKPIPATSPANEPSPKPVVPGSQPFTAPPRPVPSGVGGNQSVFPTTNEGVTNSAIQTKFTNRFGNVISTSSLQDLANNNTAGIPITNIVAGFTTNIVNGLSTNVVAGFTTNILFVTTNTLSGFVTNIVGSEAAGAAATVPNRPSFLQDSPSSRSPNLPPLVPPIRSLGTPPLL